MKYIQRLSGKCCPKKYKSVKEAVAGDIVVEGKKIVSPEMFKKQSKAAIGIICASTQETGDGRIRFVSLDYMSAMNPEKGLKTLDGVDGYDMRLYFGGSHYDPDSAVEEWHEGDAFDIDGYEYPPYETIKAQMTEFPDYPVASDKIHISGAVGYGAYAPSLNNGSVAGPATATNFKYKQSSSTVPVPFFDNGQSNKENFLASKYVASGTTTETIISNPFTDIDGKANCDIYLNYLKNHGENYETYYGETYDDDSQGDSFPAVVACHLYKKGGVQWYLPAMGELVYIYIHINEINETREALGLENLDTDYAYWSSTLVGRDSSGSVCACDLHFVNGYCDRLYWCDFYYALAVSAF